MLPIETEKSIMPRLLNSKMVARPQERLNRLSRDGGDRGLIDAGHETKLLSRPSCELRGLGREVEWKHKEHQECTKDTNRCRRAREQVARGVVDAAIAVHRALGPGPLESAYEICMAHELEIGGSAVLRQIALPVVYEAVKLEAGCRVDLMVDGAVIVEVKSVDALAPVHEAQLLTYLRLSGRRLGFLINFNVVLLKQGIKRMTL